jgi:hypothetical protein
VSRVIEGGALILTPEDARLLYQGARIADLRKRHRSGDTRFYDLLVDISRAAFIAPNAELGIEPRQETASEEHRLWTVEQVARAARLAPRTIRLDCQRRELPATKPAGIWLIEADEAKTYIARRRKS